MSGQELQTRIRQVGRRLRRRDLTLSETRNGIRVVVALGLLVAGWQFYLFVRHFLAGTPYVSRPTIVEGFLPISALVGLKSWLSTGIFPSVHAAGLVILLGILVTGVFFGRGLCSWFCPFGLASEFFGRLGRWTFERKFEPPWPIDYLLRSIKWLVLVFFLKVIVLDMSGRAATMFMQTPYNKIADAKMLYFWLEPGPIVVGTVGILLVGSLFVQNFWCRYFCPYGALLAVLGRLSPASTNLSRSDEACTDCGLCTRECPNYVDIEDTDVVTSLECTNCARCVEECEHGALTFTAGPGSRGPEVSPVLIGAGVLAILIGTMLVGMATGTWDGGVAYEEYARFIVRMESIAHA